MAQLYRPAASECLGDGGFHAVFAAKFTTYLTVMKEGTQPPMRLNMVLAKKIPVALPMMGSCFPGWFWHLEQELLHVTKNLSTCESPQPHSINKRGKGFHA